MLSVNYFTEVMRDHQSHDVLLMCINCHQESNLHDFGLRKVLEAECDAPIGTADDVKVCQYNLFEKIYDLADLSMSEVGIWLFTPREHSSHPLHALS